MGFLNLRKDSYGKHTIYKNDWMEFCTGWYKLNFKWSRASYFDNRAKIQFSLGWGQLFLKLPWLRSKYEEADPPRYGFYFYGEGLWWPDTFVWVWKRKTYHYYLPWAYDWVRTSKMLKDGSWLHQRKGDRKRGISVDWYTKETEDMLWRETYDYTYDLGEAYTDAQEKYQVRKATVTVEEREWRRRWFMWTRLFNRVRTDIDIEFDKEVGERAGSWKGGTVGCGWALLPNETPLEALRRMEKVRVFK